MYCQDCKKTDLACECGESSAAGLSTAERVVILRYSTKPPSAEGWHWQKDHHKNERCIQVHDIKGRMSVEGLNGLGGRGYFAITEKRDVAWAGPIDKPEAI